MGRSWGKSEECPDEEGEDGNGYQPKHEIMVRLHIWSMASPSVNAATTNSVAAMMKRTAETAFRNFRMADFTQPPSLFCVPNGSQPESGCG
jgi:hypothetical protein